MASIVVCGTAARTLSSCAWVFTANIMSVEFSWTFASISGVTASADTSMEFVTLTRVS